MARFVIAGSVSCPYYAKLEILADSLSINLPSFKVFKMSIPDDDWSSWLDITCKENDWKHGKSPIIWRELVERGGKGKLLGGFNDFMEYAKCYYNFESDMNTDLMLKIRDENLVTAALNEKIAAEKRENVSVTAVCIVNAHNPLCYHLVEHIVKGDVFGRGNDVELRFHGPSDKLGLLTGTAMETFDCAGKALRGISVETGLRQAAAGASYIVICDDLNYKQDDEESHTEWIERQRLFFTKCATDLDEVALETAKVIVTGKRFVNFRTHVMQQTVQRIKAHNVVASPRITERRSKAVFAKKLGVNSADVRNVVVFGDCSANVTPPAYYVTTPFVRVHKYDGSIVGPDWFSRPLEEIAADTQWLKGGFLTEQSERKLETQNLLSRPLAMSEGSAVAGLLTDWTSGSDEMFSLGVLATGQYGINDCVFSLPVEFSGNGEYKIIDDLVLHKGVYTQLRAAKQALDNELIGKEEAPAAPVVVEDQYPSTKEEESYEEDREERADDDNKDKADVADAGVADEADVEKGKEGEEVPPKADQAEPPTDEDNLKDLKTPV